MIDDIIHRIINILDFGSKEKDYLAQQQAKLDKWTESEGEEEEVQCTSLEDHLKEGMDLLKQSINLKDNELNERLSILYNSAMEIAETSKISLNQFNGLLFTYLCVRAHIRTRTHTHIHYSRHKIYLLAIFKLHTEHQIEAEEAQPTTTVNMMPRVDNLVIGDIYKCLSKMKEEIMAAVKLEHDLHYQKLESLFLHFYQDPTKNQTWKVC